MLNKILGGAKEIAIGGHVRPDGDCVGSCMGLRQYIIENYPDKKVTVYLEEIPDSFQFLKGIEEIRSEIPENKVYDLFICLDCGDKGRLGFSAPLFEQAAHTFCVDHHISNVSFAMDNVIRPDASSTSELVYELLDKKRISKGDGRSAVSWNRTRYRCIPVFLHFTGYDAGGGSTDGKRNRCAGDYS